MYNFERTEVGIENLEDHLTRARKYLLPDILRKRRRVDSEKPAIVTRDGATITYGELSQLVNRYVKVFRKRGIGYGSRIAIVSENRSEYLIAVYAGIKVGAIVATQIYRLESEELEHCINVIDTDLLLCSERFEVKGRTLAESDPDLDCVWMDEGYDTSLPELVGDQSAEEANVAEELSPEDGALVVYTSGTTGLPKAVLLSHRAIIYRLAVWSMRDGFNHGPNSIVWPPLFHMSGLPIALVSLFQGGTAHVIDGFKPKDILRKASDVNVQNLILLPGTMEEILEVAQAEGYETSDFGSLEQAGGLPDLVDAETLKRITEFFNAEALNSFGSSEGGITLCGNRIPIGTTPTDSDLAKREVPLCNLKLIDDDWNDVAPGNPGELAVQGPMLFTGYLGNPSANQQEMQNGWFRQGDIMVENEDGLFEFVDRRKYLIKSGGENIYPAEIERWLLEMNGIREVCVVREEDSSWGEVPKAFVAIKDESIDVDDILEYCEGRIARYKLPHYIVFVDEEIFPRSETGEIIRSEVEEWSVSEDDRIRNP